MTADALLDALRARGVEVSVNDGRLRYRAPVGALDAYLRRAVAEYRAELLAVLSTPSVPAWDTEAADAELRQALKVIDIVASATWLSPAQRGVLAAMRAVVEMYHLDRDLLLFGAAGWIEKYVRRWRAEHEIKSGRSDQR